ncbi:YggS family pyridoxal phosphate enzyme [Paraconexibacter antarcticus]|uniref:YggS family pyridoxal phosphate enzyme n=1 Tax=Paraconexibacter antarcticus TaxID=2949664 RepID=A0ABY5DLY1_9ACTN|nr:YggS family pyridoxal phosphate enzyme [Paraconexibacter antarcticus]UTI62898.1 YggS family pyridoxal phosphate enzyme [Paraconexibacter antarcticus]
MAELITGLEADVVRRNLDAIREDVGHGVQILAAIKYVATEELGVLAEAGVTLVGENRAQALQEKHAALGPAFTWDFIGHLQSRKVKDVVPLVRLIHSVGSESALDRLDRLGPEGRGDVRVLLEVNVAQEEGKSGFAPADLPAMLERAAAAGVPVDGLMTMPPLAPRAEDNRRWFAALAELAGAHGLRELSMGTSQDYAVAAAEGATIVRIGSSLYR